MQVPEIFFGILIYGTKHGKGRKQEGPPVPAVPPPLAAGCGGATVGDGTACTQQRIGELLVSLSSLQLGPLFISEHRRQAILAISLI